MNNEQTEKTKYSVQEIMSMIGLEGQYPPYKIGDFLAHIMDQAHGWQNLEHLVEEYEAIHGKAPSTLVASNRIGREVEDLRNILRNSRKWGWVPIESRKPEIKEGNHAITVMVSVFDPVYKEISSGNGSYVTNALYDGKVFKQLASGPKGSVFVGFVDEITHWAYYPEPAIKR